MHYSTTVAAVSSPHGRGGVALIRVSGGEAVQISSRVFHPASGKNLGEVPANTAVFGRFYDGDTLLDEGIATVYRTPRSFTGEDTVELCCHGGVLVTGLVLSAVYSAGAVPAGAGEFTKRAFLNGKLSLTQAESVGLLIEAESRAAVKLSAAAAGGALSRKLSDCADRLRLLLASSYAYIDYPDEDLTDVSRDEMLAVLSDVLSSIRRLRDSYLSGRAVSGGISCAIAGKPNVGKSSLMNLLYGGRRAIVSPVAGTTRDVIEARVAIGDVMLNLMDTAGLRSTPDEIESQGVNLAYEVIDSCELILAVFDCSAPLDDEDLSLIEYLRDTEGKTILAVLNKSDLPVLTNMSMYTDIFADIIVLSAQNETSADLLRERIERIYRISEVDFSSGEIITKARQHRAISDAYDAVERAVTALESGYTQDIAALDIELALSSIEECDSRATNTSIVDEIFARFCVGK